MPILAHYGDQGQKYGLTGKAGALVDVCPNGVTGGFFEVPHRFRVQAVLLDLAYQIASPTKVAVAEEQLAARVDAALACEKYVFVFTPAKDLSIPSMRAGLVVATDSEITSVIRRDRAERTYSVGPLVTRLFLHYFVLILAYRAHVLFGESASELRWVVQQYAELGVRGVPSRKDIDDGIYHWLKMAERLSQSLEVLRRHSHLFVPATLTPPTIGYSCFPALRKTFHSARNFLGWVNCVGREAGLKLNPAVLFGGAKESWWALYGGQPRLRINLSCAPTELNMLLGRLADALQYVDPPSSDEELLDVP